MTRHLLLKAMAVAKPASPLVLKFDPEKTSISRRQAITVLSANLWHDWPRYRDQHNRLERLARLMEIEGVDIALLQEVARRPALRVDEWLTRRLGMAYVYSRANGHEMAIGFEEGVAIFSRFPLSSPQSQQLGMGSNPFVRRLALGADVATPCGPLSVFSVHLGLLRHHNVRQVAHLLSWVTAVVRNRPAVIGGDFNAHEETRQITRVQDRWVDTFRHLHPHADGATHELRWPWGRLLRRHRLDYLFLQPDHRSWQVLEARHLHGPGGPHSDHRAVLARLAPESSL